MDHRRKNRYPKTTAAHGLAQYPAAGPGLQPSFLRPRVLQRNVGRGGKLHIGCGVKRLQGWINADGVAGVGDVVMDLQTAFEPQAYSEIYGSHVLEHCWPEDTPGILKRLHNALLPGGTLRLSVPDIRLAVKNCIDGNAYGDERSALSVIYGGSFSKNTASPDLHRQGFWKERLTRLLAEAGFVNIREWGRGQYPAIDALKDFATFPFDHTTGKSLISLNLEADRSGELPKLTERAGVDVSIILGTVERGEMLRDCVQAVRASMAGSGLSHEIIVAYGRENESSLPWMWAQKDILPVLGGMDGAIEAFNKAYAASSGRFICQINDDVLVDGDSIARAAQYLDQEAGAAGVVFKFDRGDGQGYRHETFVNALHPNQMVVRREACEAVVEEIGAFWGDSAHRTDKTYGGDTAFGIVCKWRGLRLDSVEGVTCRDLLAPDQLRATNRAAVTGDHGQKFSALYRPYMTGYATEPAKDAWPNCYVPRPGKAPRRSPIDAGAPLRVLALPIESPGWPQTALRDALAKIGPTVEVGHANQPDAALLQAAAQHRPDLVFAQIQRDGWADFARQLRKVVGPHCTMVQWNGDVRTSAGETVPNWYKALSPSFDLLLFDNCTYPKKLAADGYRAGYLSHGFESEINCHVGLPESRKVIFIGSNYIQLDHGARRAMVNAIHTKMPGALSVYGTGWQGVPQTFGEINITAASELMGGTCVTISKSLFCDLERYTSNRLKYAFASGAVTAVEQFADMAGLGLVHGENCIVWAGYEDLVSRLQEWVKPERAEARRRIRQNARAHALEHFSWDRSVEHLLAVVRDFRARKGL